MRRALLSGVLAVGVGVALAVPLFGDSAKSDSGSEVQRLTERIQQLEARVAQLEQRSWGGETVSPAPSEHVPRHWQRRQFNGMEYYIIPCRQPAGENRVE